MRVLRWEATRRSVISREQAVLAPDDVTDVVAAASMVKGITAECLMRLTYEVGPKPKC